MNNYGTEYNLSISPYCYEIIGNDNIKFKFSTAKRLKRFKDRVNYYVKGKVDKDCSKYGFDIESDILHMLILYQSIELTGFCIILNGCELSWKEVSVNYQIKKKKI